MTNPNIRRTTVALAAAVVIVSCGQVTPLGGGWQLKKKPTLPESGLPQMMLFHWETWRYAQVDDLVFLSHYYAEADCLIYGTSRGRRLFFGVCGDRIPIRLSVPADTRYDWAITADGLERWGHLRVEGGVAQRERWAFDIARIRERSRRLGARPSSWHTAKTPILQPAQEWKAIGVNDRDPQSGDSVLSLAILRQQSDVALALIEKGGDLDFSTHPNTRPVIAAAERDQVAIVRALLTAGADPLVKNGNDQDLLMIATIRKNPELLDAVLSHPDARKLDVAASLATARKRGHDQLATRLAAFAGLQ